MQAQVHCEERQSYREKDKKNHSYIYKKNETKTCPTLSGIDDLFISYVLISNASLVKSKNICIFILLVFSAALPLKLLCH